MLTIPDRVERVPTSSTSCPRRSRSFELVRTRTAPLESATTALPASTRPVGRVTTPRILTVVPTDVARASAIEMTGVPDGVELGAGLGEDVGGDGVGTGVGGGSTEPTSAGSLGWTR
jgi:hypothetical protein